MCGRFYIEDETMREIERIAKRIDRQMAKSGEVHPSEPALVLRASQDSMVSEVLKWGYEAARKNTLLFNARSETVRQRPMFRYDYETRRCLIPADKFYEWKHIGEKKRRNMNSLHKVRFCIWQVFIIKRRKGIGLPFLPGKRKGV